MSEAFHRQLLPGTYRVLGHVLPPLSLWHLEQLVALRSPLLRGGCDDDAAQLGDLQVAVKVCLSRYPHPARLQPTFRDCIQQWIFRRDEVYLRRHLQAFVSFLAVHMTPPDIWETEGAATRYLTAPPILQRVTGLMRFPCFTWAEIWNDITPGLSLWLLTASSERESTEVRFVQDGEDDAHEAIEDLEELPEEQLYAMALQELGQTKADAWLKRRREARAAQQP